MKKLIILSVMLAFLVSGCSGTASIKSQIKTAAQDYDAILDELYESSQITVKHWTFGHGLIKGALEDIPRAAYVLAELDRINEKIFEGRDEGEELTRFQHGYLMGKQIGLTGQVLQDLLLMFAPQLMGSASIMAILAFLGV